MSERFLLDTHTFLWLATAPDRVPSPVRDVLETAPSVMLASISAWEISIKYSLGKLPLPQPPVSWLPARRRAMGIEAAPFDERHALAVADLPDHHSDPFDRALVAMARTDGLTLVSADEKVSGYGVPTLWA
jgi:PIN domain nuclease of toxin-antitoxin system